jgi:dihydroorotate dehydrogenase
MYKTLARPLLFRLPPETAHHLTLNLLRLAGQFPPVLSGLRWFFAPQQPGPAVKAFGLTFSNPVGLAAGYDKEGEAVKGLASLGFGHIEVGTVTPRPQPGNPEPRVFRIPAEQAVINRMGFPSRGARAVAGRLVRLKKRGCILGINLGKNKSTSLEDACQDYQSLVQTFAPLADYLAVNVSSPNTPGLRQLQSRQALQALLDGIARQRQQSAAALGHPIPVLVKLAPDLSWPEIDDALDAIQSSGMDGVIATNTTVGRAGLASPLAVEAGGLSGLPLRERSTQVVRYIHERTGGYLPVIGVGGVMTPQDALEKLDAGATLVQLYTGMIYAGPGLVKAVLDGLH